MQVKNIVIVWKEVHVKAKMFHNNFVCRSSLEIINDSKYFNYFLLTFYILRLQSNYHNYVLSGIFTCIVIDLQHCENEWQSQPKTN